MGHSSSHHSADITSVPGHHKKKKKHQKPDSGPESEGSVDSDASSDKDSSSTEKEVMISYSRKDAEAITILRAALRREGISTWCDVQDLKVGDDFLSKIGQAVIDCKIFVFLASSSSIQSKYCQDELALAYISNKPIYPVALESSDELFDKMDTGMRLQLARFDWSFFLEPSEYEENFNKLLVKLKDDLVKSGNARVSLLTESMEDLGELLQRSSSKPAMRVDIKRDISFPGSGDDETDDAFLFSFWERHFGDAQNVPWFEFVKEFSVEYNKQIDHIFREEKDKVWLISILHRELDVTSNKLKKKKVPTATLR